MSSSPVNSPVKTGEETPPLARGELRRERTPAVWPAVVFAAGIALDDCWAGRVSWGWWMAGGVAAAVIWLAGRRFFREKTRERIGVAALLAGLCCAGAARHHQVRRLIAPDDISRLAGEEAVLVRLKGTVISSPQILPRPESAIGPAWPQDDRSVALIRCRSVRTEDGERPVSGRAGVQVGGHLTQVEAGDEVEILGWLAKPRGPRNPGESDFRESLLRDGVRSLVYVGHPDAVRKTGRWQWTPHRWLGRLRNRADELLTHHLRGRTLSIASALLLGNRTQLDGETRRAFVNSGLMHLLAISGLHVGLLAGLIWLLCRGAGLPFASVCAATIGGVVLYALLTDVRPSVVRATIVICLLLGGQLLQRRASVLNTLSVAALLILIWNPLDLFHVGAQLSFLSVLGIVAAERWTAGFFHSRKDDLSENRPPWWKRAVRFTGRGLLRTYAATAVIWLFVTPLVAARFHVISPVGLLINVGMIPLVVLALWSGFLLLFGGLLVPAVASGMAGPLTVLLGMLTGLIEGAADVRAGHFFVPGPSDGWLFVYYALLLAGVLIQPAVQTVRWLKCAVIAWLAFGLAAPLRPVSSPELHCTFLSVGHGTSVLVELPDGRTLLYDAGSLNSPHKALRAVQSVLATRGKYRLDALLISHADLDHFNAVPELLKTVPTGRIYVTAAFLQSGQRGPRIVRATAAERGIPLHLLRAGDVLGKESSAVIRVLHPAERRYENDNAASLVLEITTAGRRILLTGDIERDGLARLLQHPARQTDVMLAPHHGSLPANSDKLVRWANPSQVVVSGGRRVPLQKLRKIYGRQRRVYSTERSGAVRVSVSANGRLRLQEFLAEPRRRK